MKTKVKDTQYFTENPFNIFDVLRVTKFKQQYKTKNIGGEWKKTDELEDILSEWEVCQLQELIKTIQNLNVCQ